MKLYGHYSEFEEVKAIIWRTRRGFGLLLPYWPGVAAFVVLRPHVMVAWRTYARGSKRSRAHLKRVFERHNAKQESV